jgi:hypothetical protein
MNEHKDRWGREWIMIANPTHGSFETAPFNHDFKLSTGDRRKAKRPGGLAGPLRAGRFRENLEALLSRFSRHRAQEKRAGRYLAAFLQFTRLLNRASSMRVPWLWSPWGAAP